MSPEVHKSAHRVKQGKDTGEQPESDILFLFFKLIWLSHNFRKISMNSGVCNFPPTTEKYLTEWEHEFCSFLPGVATWPGGPQGTVDTSADKQWTSSLFTFFLTLYWNILVIKYL